MANKIVIVELSYLTDSGIETTLYFSEMGFVTDPTQSPSNTVIEGRIMNGIRLGIAVSCIIWGEAVSSSIENIELANADGYFDPLLSMQWRDQPLYVHEIDVGDNIDENSRIAAGIIDRIEIVNREKVRIVAYEKLQLLERALQIDLYDESVANSDIVDTAKPWIVGNVENIRPILVNSDPDLIYEVNSREPNVIVNVREGGAVLVETTDYSVDPLGFTLVGSPNNQLTASVATSTTGGYDFLDPDMFEGIGDFNSWTGGEADGWDFLPGFGDGAYAESGAGGEVSRTSSTNNGTFLDLVRTENDIGRFIPGDTYRYSIDIISESGNGPGVGIKSITLAIEYTTIFFPVKVMFGNGGHTLNGASGTFTGEFIATAPIGSTGFGRVGMLIDTDNGVSTLVFDNFTIRKVKPSTDDSWPGICKELIFNSGFEDSEIDFTDGDTFQAQRDYALNLFVDPNNTLEIRQTIKEVCDSVAGWLYTLPNGKFALDRIKPASNSPVLTIDDEEIEGDIVQTPDLAPGLTTRLNVDRNWHPHTDGSILGVVSAQEQQRLISDYLSTVECSDVEVLDPTYEHAKHAEPRGTLLRSYFDVPLAEINEQVGLYAQKRYFYSVTGVLDPLALTLRPGQTVRLKSLHYGLEHGTDLIVVENNPTRGDETTNLVLWGTGGRYRIDHFTDFNGSTDYYSGAFPIALSNSTKFTVAYIVEFDALGIPRIFTNGFFAVYGNSPDTIRIQGNNPSAALVLLLLGTTSFEIGKRYAVAISVDMDVGYKVVINGRIEKLTENTFTSGETIKISNNNWGFGANSAGANKLNGRLAFLSIMPGVALDIYDQDVYLTLFSRQHYPMDIGSDGSDVYGSAAPIYLPEGNATNNRGTAGNIATANGTPTPHTTSPTDDSPLPAWIRYQPAAKGPFSTSNHYGGLTSYQPADGTVVSWCLWIYLTSAPSSNAFVFNWGSRGLQIFFNGTTDVLRFVAEDTGGVIVAEVTTSPLVANTPYAIVGSMNVDTGEMHLYVNDVSDKTEVTVPSGDIIDFSVANAKFLGAFSATLSPLDFGYISLFGIARKFIDFSKSVNRRKIFDKYGRPKHGGYAGIHAFGRDALVDFWIRHGDGTLNEGLAGPIPETGTVPWADTYPADV